MTSRLSSSFLPFTFFSLLLTTSLMWLHAAAAADKAISIPVQITHAQSFDPFPSPDGKKLVFISMLCGKEHLFTMDASTAPISSSSPVTMPTTKIPRGHRMEPGSHSCSSPRTVTASRS